MTSATSMGLLWEVTPETGIIQAYFGANIGGAKNPFITLTLVPVPAAVPASRAASEARLVSDENAGAPAPHEAVPSPVLGETHEPTKAADQGQGDGQGISSDV